MRPPVEQALQEHFTAIARRDLVAFEAHLTTSEVLYTIVQNGHAFTTREELIELHRQWFLDPLWTWNGKVVHVVEGQDVALAVVQYEYRPRPEDKTMVNWLTYGFRWEDGAWRIVHDHSTAQQT